MVAMLVIAVIVTGVLMVMHALVRSVSLGACEHFLHHCLGSSPKAALCCACGIRQRGDLKTV